MSSPSDLPDLLHDPKADNIPPELARATQRLGFPPSYVVVGVYRLFTDKNLYTPVWEKCKQGTQRGLMVGLVWVSGCSTSRAISHLTLF
jgi:hypothetical protein